MLLKALKESRNWAVKNLVEGKDFSFYFKTTKFSYILRNINEAVHCLAKLNFTLREKF